VAASVISPYVAADEIKLADAVLLLKETGHPISIDHLTRLCRQKQVPLVRQGRPLYASWTEVLKVHRDWVNAKR
jgi:hypothetical protein